MAANTFTKCAKYTVAELESYVADPNSCVQKLEWTNLVSVLPKYLGNICEGVKACLTQKIGKYDRAVDGIILAFKNTKILSPMAAMRPSSVRIHVKVSSNFYVFRPVSGATIEGTIKYVSKNYLSAVIYRVFNVTIRLQRQKLQEVKQGRVISFIVKSFDMKSDLPFIEGELLSPPDEEQNGELLELVEHKVKKEKSSRKQMPIKSEPMEEQEEVAEVNTIAEPVTIPHRNRSKTEPATEESESDNDEPEEDVNQSMKAILDNLQKEMSDAADSASESLKKHASAKTPDANKKTKRKKGEDTTVVKKEPKAKQSKQNGHSSNTTKDNSMDDSIAALLNNIEKRMSDITDSDYSSSRQDESKIGAPSRVKAEKAGKKHKKEDKSSPAKKGNKRKAPKINGHSSGDDPGQHDTADPIKAFLSILEKEMSDATDSDRGTSMLDTTRNTEAAPVAKPPTKKKKNKSSLESLEKELFRKLAAEYSEQKADEPAEAQKQPEKSPKKKKKKKPKANDDEDDFEASIMSSMLKCAALADERDDEAPKDDSLAPSPSKKRKTDKTTTARKSVRFDSTITEASFNAFDSSELLEISQLQAPALSSTLKGSS